MDVILVGPGRAGLALSLRLAECGHELVGVLARDAEEAAAAAARLGCLPLAWDRSLPGADLMLVAVSDDAIAAVATRLRGSVGGIDAAVHVSGLKAIDELAALDGPRLGSFHPLQTMPTPQAGAEKLRGAWVAVTSEDDYLADRLFALATSIGMHPFELDDGTKALYHAAAAAAANYPLAALAMAQRLFAAAGVPFEAAGPLVEAVVANALEMGPRSALTGPIARDDLGTVRAQIAAVDLAAPELADHFRAMGLATADAADASDEMREILS